MWLDIFQKVKSLGFSAVSFYTHWALFEGEPGVYNASGIFDLVPFFDAASEAGIYLIARPGPVSLIRLRYSITDETSISMLSLVVAVFLDGYSASRGYSEHVLQTIWLQQTTMLLTLRLQLLLHRLQTVAQSFCTRLKMSIHKEPRQLFFQIPSILLTLKPKLATPL